jgi:signal transduction histidine kinase
MPERRRFALTAVRTGVRRTGGAWSTSWAVIVTMCLILVLDRVGTDLERTGEPMPLVSSGLVGAAAIAVVLRAAHWTVLRGAEERPRPVVAAFTLTAAGAAAAIAGNVHDRAARLPVKATLGYFFERTAWAVGFLVVLTIAADALMEYRTQFRRIATQNANLLRTRTEVTGLLAHAVRAELAVIAEQVRADLARLDDADRHEALRLLRHAGDEVVRSRSHELAKASVPYRPVDVAPELPTRTLVGLAADATAGRSIRPGVPGVFVGLWGFGASLVGLGLPTAAMVGILVGMVTASIFGLFGVLVRIGSRGSQPAARITFALLATLAASTTWALTLRLLEAKLAIPLPTGGSNVQVAVQALLMTAVPIAQSVGRAARHQDERSVAELRRINTELEHEVARANSDLWAQRRALARALHGPVQAAINAAALRLSMAGDDAKAIEAAVAQARTAIEASLVDLERTVTDDRLDATDDLDQAIARIRGLWEGVVDVDVVVAPELATELADDSTMTAALVDVLAEACSNAVRHGRARHIRARLQGEADHVTLEVVDDGQPGTIGAPGGGSDLLDEITLAWQRTHEVSGTRLTASFARP